MTCPPLGSAGLSPGQRAVFCTDSGNFGWIQAPICCSFRALGVTNDVTVLTGNLPSEEGSGFQCSGQEDGRLDHDGKSYKSTTCKGFLLVTSTNLEA